MQTANINCNCPKPQFGMALKKPDDIEKFVKYAGLDKKLPRMGVQQIVREQAKNKNFDIIMDNDMAVKVIRKTIKPETSPEIVEVFPASRHTIAGIRNKNISEKADIALESARSRTEAAFIVISATFKLLFNIARTVVNPKLAVKGNIREAAEYAARADKAEIAKEAAHRKIIAKANKIFEK